ncbi:SPOC domain-like protein [Gloeophyllum trabeum ATCC 11539]|uniref:ATP-dependent DNA helicase II subunit 2 n=1 Tax=Gloeophyllum trabeum (strain ATCC 11539 / FP-39264 / Madison 617) TaxID=670483 RepID=S7S191_GLOTA|nr:SPOC domain-like protein [Gloeophyllum trabeum ATCC 11539]EPQ61200.1 SPOC domain-like protein [Gloeophyllum trabeum ATCC 11539]
MFLVDVSASMGKLRTVDLPDAPNGEPQTAEMTNLEWALQFVKLKIQEMIYHGRKTEQCGVILFGAEETKNIIHDKSGGYEHVMNYIDITMPNAGTLAKLSELEPSEEVGDPIDALVVGIETQRTYLANKKTWTKKIVLLTDGANPIEVEDWEAIVEKMNTLDISLTIVGVDFDDDELPFHEGNKSTIKRANEAFFHNFVSRLENGIVGTCALALREISRPDVKIVKSTLMGSILRLGDVDARSEEAIEVLVKYSKCTAVTRPKGFKKFGKRKTFPDGTEVDSDKALWVELKQQTQYVLDEGDEDSDIDMKDEEQAEEGDKKSKNGNVKPLTKEELQRGFKYGSTYVLCPDGSFPKLETRKGIDIAGFFKSKNFRRDHAMGEVYYVWADPTSPQQQVAFSSIVQAMFEQGVMAISRWVSRDGADPKMGVLSPSVFESVDCLLWVQMPFADDVRKYTFASLENLVNKNGERILKHPYLPTNEQLDAMDNFVDAMDLMDAGEKDEEGNRGPWFDVRFSYNPAVHRVKQALFHSAIVSDLTTNPLPPPHPELLKYFDPPKRVLKRARPTIEECKNLFNVKEVPKRVFKQRKDGHVRAADEDQDMLLLEKIPRRTQSIASQSQLQASGSSQLIPAKTAPEVAAESETEDEDEEMLLDGKKTPNKPQKNHNIPTPAPESPEHDMGRDEGRIVGRTRPLEDFRKNLVKGDLVSKAVGDLAYVIKDIVLKPFASRRTEELLQCMQELREVCLKEDEIDVWNDFIQELKDACLEYPGNPEFWDAVRKLGRGISLISKPEAKEVKGKSAFSEALAIQASLLSPLVNFGADKEYPQFIES